MAQNPLSDTLKEYRVFSISAFIFVACLLYEFIHWIMDKSTPNDLGDGAVVTAVVGSLVGLAKFIFEFATKDTKRKAGQEE